MRVTNSYALHSLFLQQLALRTPFLWTQRTSGDSHARAGKLLQLQLEALPDDAVVNLVDHLLDAGE